MRDEICVSIVDFIRSRMVGNVQQALAGVLAVSTMCSPTPSEYISIGILGISASGKNRLERTIMELFPSEHIYHATSATDTAFIYDGSLHDPNILYMRLAEYQKMGQKVVEIMKALHADDESFVHKRTQNTEVLSFDVRKMPYSFSCAQIGLIDHELNNRYMSIYVETNVRIIHCVKLIKLKAKAVEYDGIEHILVPRTAEERAEREQRDTYLMNHFKSMCEAKINGYMSNPVTIDFQEALVNVLSDTDVTSNRRMEIFSNLLVASARINHMNRDIDDDGVIHVNAQDVANVMSLYEFLQASLMDIDTIDWEIYNNLMSGWKTTHAIINFLMKKGLPELTQDELNTRLDGLFNRNYIQKDQRKGGTIKYTANPYKCVLSPHVDWKQIAIFDNDEVINPVTKEVYENIILFGQAVEDRYARHGFESKLYEQTEDDQDERETLIRDALITVVLRDGQFISGEKALINAVSKQLGEKVMSLDLPSTVRELLDDGEVVYNMENRCYTLP